MLANCVSDKRFVADCMKNFYNSTAERHTTQLKSGKRLKQIFLQTR